MTTNEEATGLEDTVIENTDTEVSELVTIENYYPDNKRITKDRFKDMIEHTISEETTCDALVISGHHTGDFTSEEKGILPLELIEELSCKDEYQSWFANVKALYLHGSNTTRDKYLKSAKADAQQDFAITGDTDSTNPKKIRNLLEVGRNVDLPPDESSANAIFYLNHSYAGTLDEHTPLSSRYLRAFPNTNIYGFKEVAGKGEGNKDIIKHINNVTKALIAEGKITSGLSETKKFLKGLDTIINKNCDPKNLEAWQNINTSRFEAVANKNYQEAKDLGCELIKQKKILEDKSSSPENKNKAKENILQKLSEIAEDKEGKDFSPLLINNIYETVLLADKMAKGKYGARDSKFIGQVKKALQKSEFKEALKEKIKSPLLSSLRKGNYIKLYQRLWKEDTSTVKNAVNNLLGEANSLNRSGNSNKQILAVHIFDQLSQYDLLSTKQINTAINTIPSGEGTTAWQKSMRHRFEYRSYTTNPKKNHPFIKNLQTNKRDPAYVGMISAEIRRKGDIKTALKLAEVIAPDSYWTKATPENTAFRRQLIKHIPEASPREGENRLQMIDRYFKEAKGNDNFQVNLLWSLYNLPDEEFSNNPTDYGDSNTKKDFFGKLEANNLTDNPKVVFEHLQKKFK